MEQWEDIDSFGVATGMSETWQSTVSSSGGSETLHREQEVSAVLEWRLNGQDDPQREIGVQIGLKVLNRFMTGKDGASPKKENFRIAHIRSFNKSLRQIRTRKWPKRGLHALNSSSESARQHWRQYYQLFKAFRPELDFHSKPTLLSERSFNNRYCRKLFESEAIRKLYFEFSELVYADSDTEALCDKLRMRCCDNREHTNECLEKWREARMYAQYGMLIELGVEPWNGRSWGPPQWFEVEGNSPDRYLSTTNNSQ